MRDSSTEEPANDLDVNDKKEAEENNRRNSEKKSPDKMGDKSPPKQQKQRTGKGFTYEVVLLDGEHVNFELDKNADGRELFDRVCHHLDLQEKDYFGLQFVDERLPHHMKCWLSSEKKISKQKKRGPWLFDFALKFYPPDPTQLRESLTRWLVTLQVRRDILSGKLPATFLTQAMLGSYCVQADVGDYDPSEHHGIEYIKDIPFAPNQTVELLEKIVELHRQHKGQTPDEAEINFLENAKKLAMYGVDLHQAEDPNGKFSASKGLFPEDKDANNVEIMLGVCASGLQVYREKLRISRFVWPKIIKISYKRRHFYVKVRPQDNNQPENAVSFRLKSHRLAKRLWKICVEHHAFFRLREAEQNQNSAMFPRLGSKFRYSGRTLYQARHSSQILDRPDPYFERSQPARSTYAAPSNRSRSVDELSNRPDYWKDDMDVEKRRPSEGRDGRDRRDHMGQPTVISQVGLPAGMKPVGDEEGNELRPGDKSYDGRDRRDRMPGEDDATLNKKGGEGDTMGLSPAELQKKAKEEEKERKKREKEEEKRRKKEEEERKKAEKAAKKGKKGPLDPTAEDRRDLMGAGDNTERAPGRTPGSYGDEEGGPMRYESTAPVGSFAPGDKDKDKDKDRYGPGYNGEDRDRWAPGKDGYDPERDRWSPGRGRDGDGRDRFAPGRDGEGKDGPWRDGEGKDGPWREGEDRDRYAPGRDGDKARLGPGGEGSGPFSPTGDKERWGRDGEWSPGKEGEDRQRFAPGENGYEDDPARFGPGFARVGSGRDEDRNRKDSDKDKDDKDKKGKKGKKDRKGSDKDDEKDKGRKGSEKEDDKDGKKDKKDKKKDKDEKKGGGLFGKFGKKHKDKHPDEPESPGSPGDKGAAGYPGYGPGFVPGLGVGAGDMSGVQGEESWIDNKQRFEPIVPPKKESKDSLTAGGDSIDHTMPFFSPAATSTFGRPGKVPPPVPPKHNSFGGDDSFSRTDVYKTEKDGIQETRVEHKVVLSSNDDDFDYDAALAEAIRSVTEFNPDMSVERIECVQQIEDVEKK